MGRSFFGDAASSEDAVQDALMRLWTVWSQVSTVADAERLAVRLTKHACISGLRSQHVRKVVPLEADQTTDVASTAAASDKLLEREVREALALAVSHLRPSERRMWTMFAEAQMETAQIAAATGIDVRTVSAMLSAARSKIKEELRARLKM